MDRKKFQEHVASIVKASKSVAERHGRLADAAREFAKAVDGHIAALGALANAGRDVWPLGESNIDSNGRPVNGPSAADKVAKSFMDEIYREGGLFKGASTYSDLL